MKLNTHLIIFMHMTLHTHSIHMTPHMHLIHLTLHTQFVHMHHTSYTQHFLHMTLHTHSIHTTPHMHLIHITLHTQFVHMHHTSYTQHFLQMTLVFINTSHKRHRQATYLIHTVTTLHTRGLSLWNKKQHVSWHQRADHVPSNTALAVSG